MVTAVLTFSTATVSTIPALNYLSCRAYRPPVVAGREDIISGLITALTGVAVCILEIAYRENINSRRVTAES